MQFEGVPVPPDDHAANEKFAANYMHERNFNAVANVIALTSPDDVINRPPPKIIDVAQAVGAANNMLPIMPPNVNNRDRGMVPQFRKRGGDQYGANP